MNDNSNDAIAKPLKERWEGQINILQDGEIIDMHQFKIDEVEELGPLLQNHVEGGPEWKNGYGVIVSFVYKLGS